MNKKGKFVKPKSKEVLEAGFLFWAILATILFIILFGTIKIEVHTVVRKRVFYVVKITFCGIKVYGAAICIRLKGTINLQILYIKKKGYQILTDFKSVLRGFIEAKKEKKLNFNFILKSLKIEKGRADIAIGTGNAAATALICGAVTTALSSIIRIIDLTNVSFIANPNFEKEEFSVHINCILSAFLAQIIYEFIKQKGGSKNAPDREYLEDDYDRVKRNG